MVLKVFLIRVEKKYYIKTTKSATEINASKASRPASDHPWHRANKELFNSWNGR